MLYEATVGNGIFDIDILIVFDVFWCFTEFIDIKILKLKFSGFDVLDYLGNNTLYRIFAVFIVNELHA